MLEPLGRHDVLNVFDHAESARRICSSMARRRPRTPKGPLPREGRQGDREADSARLRSHPSAARAADSEYDRDGYVIPMVRRQKRVGDRDDRIIYRTVKRLSAGGSRGLPALSPRRVCGGVLGDASWRASWTNHTPSRRLIASGPPASLVVDQDPAREGGPDA